MGGRQVCWPFCSPGFSYFQGGDKGSILVVYRGAYLFRPFFSEILFMKLALVGSNGMLAQMLLKKAPKGYEIHPFSRPDFDLANRSKVVASLENLKPSVIINCAAYNDVDGAETHGTQADCVNKAGPGYLAEAAVATGAVLVHISTDYVFSGEQNTPYKESDRPEPLSIYGRSKLEGEKAIVATGIKRYFILRTSWLFGPGGKNFVETMLRLAADRDELRVVADHFGTPTYTGDLADAIYRLLALGDRDDIYGLYHFSNRGETSWHGFAEEIITQARQQGECLRAARVVPISSRDYPLPAPRPAYSVLCKEKYLNTTGGALPHWRESLALYLRERKH